MTLSLSLVLFTAPGTSKSRKGSLEKPVLMYLYKGLISVHKEEVYLVDC